MMKLIKTICIISLLFIMGCKKEANQLASTDFIIPNDFLSSQKYEALIVEINYMGNNKPSNQAINNLKTFLSERLNKPSGIEIKTKAIPNYNKSKYSLNDIKEIEGTYRKYFPLDKILAAHILFVDGGYTADNNNTKVLGIAYGKTSMTIFQKTIKDYSGGITQPSKSDLETAVINHEFGHTLGLVNNGTPDINNHQDTPNGHHCDNSNCLMYYAAETTDILGSLVSGAVPTLDNNCISDLQANGGK